MDRWLTVMVFVLVAEHGAAQLAHVLFYFLAKVLHRKAEVRESAQEAWHLVGNQRAHVSLVAVAFGLSPGLGFLLQLVFLLDYVVFHFLDVF